MRVYVTPPQPSLGLQRIADALTRYAPSSVEVLSFPRNADLTVLWAIGRLDRLNRQAQDILSRGKKYAVIQVCLRSTMQPDPWKWMQLWEGATTVWSYYDLDAALNEGNDDPTVKYHMPCDFYHAPLGADAGVFKPHYAYNYDKFIIGTCGLSRLQESVRECHLAAKAVGQQAFHLGPNQWNGDGVTFAKNIIDEQVANYWSSCAFVSGLRRKEGFELPAVEGLLCGSRPICFNTKDYRTWYDGFAEFIEETDRQGVVDQLVQLFKRGPRPVTAEERERAVERFNWATIVGDFWERVL